MKIGEPFNPRRLFVGIWIPEALAKSKLFSPTAKLCFGHLARRAGENGHCFPSRQEIGEHIGVAESQVKRVLRELVNGRLIRVVARAASNGRQTSNEYEFLWHEILEESTGQGEGVINGPLAINGPGRGPETSPTRGPKTSPLEERTSKRELETPEKPSSSAVPAELADLLPIPIDDDGIALLWTACRTADPECTASEVAEAAKAKLRQVRNCKNPVGLIIAAVPLMFSGRAAFPARLREHKAQEAKMLHQQEEASRRELEKLANDPLATEEDRRLLRTLLRGAA